MALYLIALNIIAPVLLTKRKIVGMNYFGFWLIPYGITCANGSRGEKHILVCFDIPFKSADLQIAVPSVHSADIRHKKRFDTILRDIFFCIYMCLLRIVVLAHKRFHIAGILSCDLATIHCGHLRICLQLFPEPFDKLIVCNLNIIGKKQYIFSIAGMEGIISCASMVKIAAFSLTYRNTRIDAYLDGSVLGFRVNNNDFFHLKRLLAQRPYDLRYLFLCIQCRNNHANVRAT